jgi:hypothetical protein
MSISFIDACEYYIVAENYKSGCRLHSSPVIPICYNMSTLTTDRPQQHQPTLRTHAKARNRSPIYTLPTALSLHSHNSPFPFQSSNHLSTDLLTFPTGRINFPCALPGASGLVAAYKEVSDPSSAVTVGVIFIENCMSVPSQEGSLPWRLVWMRPGWRE